MIIKLENIKALIVGFYLSKYDEIAYENLHLGNKKRTHQTIGQILNVNPNTINNMRDEFDPYHSNPRLGWHLRPLRASRLKVYDSLSSLSEKALYGIVIDIINKSDNVDLNDLYNRISMSEVKKINKSIDFTTRGITGEMAEKYFVENWSTYYPESISIKNTSKLGCGYDFEVLFPKGKKFIEVKGMIGSNSGVLLTDKEWNVANEMNDQYELFIVFDINSNPNVRIISNPTKKLNPLKTIKTVIQVNWQVSNKQIVE